MSTIALQGRGILGRFTTQGVSEEASVLQGRIAMVLNRMLQSETLGEPISEALNALREVFEECSEDNWDGYGASAISINTYLESRRFLQILPTTIPIPEITAEPDGEIAFEWFIKPRRILSVSVGSDRILTYAGIFGINKTHGTEYFGDELPAAILSNLQRLFA